MIGFVNSEYFQLPLSQSFAEDSAEHLEMVKDSQPRTLVLSKKKLNYSTIDV